MTRVPTGLSGSTNGSTRVRVAVHRGTSSIVMAGSLPTHGPLPMRTCVRYGRRMAAYAELHCHTNFSFLDGASHPEELADEAARLGLAALAVTDHDGLYGVVRFALAARATGLPTVFGAELTLGDPRTPPNG